MNRSRSVRCFRGFPSHCASLLFAGLLVASLAIAAPGFAIGFESSCRDFVRGDSNSDGTVDLSDGVFTLNALFAGGSSPACESALDADDSGEVELTDAIFTFQWLFLGGREPPAPGPRECGEDPTFDALSCERSPVCDPPAVPSDRSETSSFTYRVVGALGFCPEIGGVGEATLLRREDGSFEVSLSIFTEVEANEETPCLPGIFEGTCVVLEERATRMLTGVEAARWIELNRSIVIYLAPEPFCRCVAIDPCTIDQVEWDAQTFTDFPCSSSRIPFETMREIRAFLLELARVD